MVTSPLLYSFVSMVPGCVVGLGLSSPCSPPPFARAWFPWDRKAEGPPWTERQGRARVLAEQGADEVVEPICGRVIDARHVTRYVPDVIKSFANRTTEELFRTGAARKVPAEIARRALRKLEAVHAASQVTDLRVPPGNRLHALKGDRAGQHSIAVNDQWRICFRFDDGDAYEVEFCDYH